MSNEKISNNYKLYIYISIMFLKIFYNQTNDIRYSMASSFMLIVLGFYTLNKNMKKEYSYENLIENEDSIYSILYIIFGTILLYYDYKNYNKKYKLS